MDDLSKILENLPPDKLDKILRMAEKKLGKSKTELQQDLSAGSLKNISGGQAEYYLNNPDKLDALIKSPKAQKMLKDLLG